MAQVFQINIGHPKSTQLSVDAEYHRKYTSEYQIYTARFEDPYTTKGMEALPQYGDTYDWYGFVDTWAFCRDITVTRKAEIKDQTTNDIRTLWTVRVVHDSKPTGGSNDFQGRNNPLNDPIVVSGGFGVFKREVTRDRFLDDIVNAVGDPYDSPKAEVDAAVDTLSMSYNTSTIDLGLRANLIGKVNATVMWGLERRRVKLTQWNYSVQRAGPDFEYIKHDFEFQVSFEEHPNRFIARGPRQLGLEGPGDSVLPLKGYYTTLPNSGELHFKEDWSIGQDTSPMAGPTESRLFANRVPDNMEKFASDDEVVNGFGQLEADGTKRESGPMLWNIFQVTGEEDFGQIERMPIIALPGPFA